MKKNVLPNWRQSDTLLSVFAFVFLLTFTYGLLFVAPYPGFYFNPTDGRVLAVFRPESSSIPLEIGDVIERINGTPFDTFREDLDLVLFQGVQKGQTIEIEIQRGDQELTLSWMYPGFNRTEFLGRFINIWWLAYIFWFIGTAAQLLMRPKDTQRRLFVASSYLTGMFLMLGSVSSYRVLMSSVLLRVAAWLLLPVYLHFHWIFPTSFRRVPQWLKAIFYVVFGAISLGQLFQLVPNTLYFVAVLLAFGGSILLLLFHYILQPEYRSDVRFLAIAAFLALFPVTLIVIISSTGKTPEIGPLSLVALPILPLAYFYILYRRSLGGLELRTNRAISLYLFLVVLSGVLFLVTGLLGFTHMAAEAFLFVTVITALITTFLGVLIFPAFQSFVERRLLGVKLPAQNMVESFSSRIVTSNSMSELLKLLEDEVFPSLLIRQYAFVRIANSSARIILSREVDQIPEDALMDLSASSSTGQLLPLSKDVQSFGWIHLVLPLRVGSELIGAWLLGRRDPDDHYPQAELPILGSLANQTAVALSNIVQTERLKVMYTANIHRYEQERLRLGHELHDSLLNEMAAMLMKHDPDALPREFQESFDGLILRLREIVQDLRPPMLVYGLKYALDGLADNLSERNHDLVSILSQIQTVEECRYPETVEHNIYRIVQEACENASKYAHAQAIRIVGELSPGRIDIQVIDDGVGFKDDVSLLLDEMVANKHYGLAGMHERANLIGAIIRIDSRPNLGTQIQVVWEAEDTI